MSVNKKIWENYSKVYDKILPLFKTYQKLLDELILMVKLILVNINKKRVNILELGSGTGLVLEKLLSLKNEYPDKEFKFVGIDFMNEALHIAKKKLNNEVDLYRGDLGLKNFGLLNNTYNKLMRNKFHIIIINNVTYSLSISKRLNMLNEIKKLLDSNGFVIISEPVKKMNFLQVLRYYIKKYGLFEIVKFLKAVGPYKTEFNELLSINYKYLARAVQPYFNQKIFFEDNGFKQRALYNEAFSKNNTIEIYYPFK